MKDRKWRRINNFVSLPLRMLVNKEIRHIPKSDTTVAMYREFPVFQHIARRNNFRNSLHTFEEHWIVT